MGRRKPLDEMDRSILEILSAYDHLTPLQLWYELGEDDSVKEDFTEEDVQGRLQALTARGFVERITIANPEGGTENRAYCVRPNGAGSGPKRSTKKTKDGRKT